MRATRTALAVVLACAATSARAEEASAPLYTLVGGYGPGGASFPWDCAYSPDGKWIGFSDGHSAYVEIWDETKRVWPPEGERFGGTHRVAFSPDSKRMAFVRRGLYVVAWDGREWKVGPEIPLGFEPGISSAWSPWRLEFTEDGSALVMGGANAAWRVDLATRKVERLLPEAEDVVATFVLPGGAVAVGRSKAFVTTVLRPKEAPRDVPGVLLAESPDARLWLVASDVERFDMGFLETDRDSRLALEVREAGTAKALGSFEASGRRKPGNSYGHRLLLEARFSPDGRHLATVHGTGEIVLRDARTGAPVQRIDEYAHLPYPMGVAFSPDGETLVTGGRRPYGKDLPDVLRWKRRRP